jgi:hypothetical protein
MAIVGQRAWESQFDVRSPACHIEQFDVRGQSVRAEGEALTLLRILDTKMTRGLWMSTAKRLIKLKSDNVRYAKLT